MKPFATGVCIGKFYPPHRGHTYLIDTALAQSERVTVFLAAPAPNTPRGGCTIRQVAVRTANFIPPTLVNTGVKNHDRSCSSSRDNVSNRSRPVG